MTRIRQQLRRPETAATRFNFSTKLTGQQTTSSSLSRWNSNALMATARYFEPLLSKRGVEMFRSTFVSSECRSGIDQRAPRMRSIGLAVTLLLMALPGQAATVTVAADSYVSSSNATVNYGSAAVLSVGDGASALIAFDLSSLPAGLTASNIEKATLTVFVHKAYTAGALDLAQVTAPWSEALVTYNNRPTTAAAVQSVPVSASETYVTFDITLLVRQWVIGAAENYGVEIRASAGQPGTMVDLDSKESTSTSHSALAEITLVSMGPQGSPGTPGKTGDTGATGPQGPPGPNVLQAGTATAPSLSFLGNSNTGLFSSAPNTVNIATNGQNRVSVGPSGDVDLRGNITQGGALMIQLANSINSLSTSFGAGNLASSTGHFNTAIGVNSMTANTTGTRNTALGAGALNNVTTNSNNTAIGQAALAAATGNSNVAVGALAGATLHAGDNNIYIANGGSPVESGVTRIGQPAVQTATFIAGINGVTPASGNVLPVVIDSNGQLGTTTTSPNPNAGFRCAGSGYVMGYDASGVMMCNTGVVAICAPATFTATVTSGVGTGQYAGTQFWDAKSFSFGSNGCTVQIQPPATPNRKFSCDISSTACYGWLQSGTTTFSSCSISAALPVCPAGTTAHLNGNEPYCSSATAGPATDTATITCH